MRVREAERVLARAKARLPVKAREVKRAQAKAEALAKAHELVLSLMAQMAMPQRRSIADLILSPRNASAEWRQQTHLFDMERALPKAVSDLAQVQAARARHTPSPIHGPRNTVTDSESDGVTVTVTSMMAPSQSK